MYINAFFHFREKRDEDYEYDHEAFLGAEDAHEFDDLDPEESKVSSFFSVWGFPDKYLKNF